ncbi:unnamed protein product [Cylindrotheca closterium]|uniref:Putative gamma-glutamylcyclotransferase n=1 Tax=Cylindrotheca closterium TaxID=2856 RepID=A0AAD2PVV0_9STRA|nr:unnamed protein product [Cylindrotheca closterium]
MRPVFVYGTLSSPQVVETLLGRPLSVESFPPAILDGHSRHPVKGFVFPAMISNPTKQVNGLLIEDLTPKELELFDWFESDEYIRKVVEVRTKNQKSVEAFAYIWNPDLMEMLLLDQEWSFENFCKENKELYLKNTVTPCRKEMESLGMTISRET